MILKRRWILALPLILLFLSCPPVNVSPIEIKLAIDQQLSDEFGGLKIGVSLYLDPDESRETLGTDLFSKGIIPVFVVIENDTNSNFKIDPTLFYLYPAFIQETIKSNDKILSSTIDITDKTESTFSANVVRTSTTVIGVSGVASFTVNVLQTAGTMEEVSAIASLNIPFINAIGTIALIPLSIAGEYKSRDIQINHHMIAKALAKRTLYQGQSTQGFLYFIWNSFDKINNNQELTLRATLSSISEPQVLCIDIPIGRIFSQEPR